MYFFYLDSIRGIAILLVLLVHSVIFGFLARQGDLGVSLFFALSGFLLSYLSCEQIYLQGFSSINLFWGKRAKRLLPAIMVFILLLLPIQLFYPKTITEIFLLISLQTNFAIYFKFAEINFSSHIWSLCAEIQFYIIFSLTLIIVNNINVKRKILFFCNIQICLTIFFFFLSIFFFHNQSVNNYNNIKFFAPTSLFQLFLGSFTGTIFFAIHKINILKTTKIKTILQNPFFCLFCLCITLFVSIFVDYPVSDNPYTTLCFSILSIALVFSCTLQSRNFMWLDMILSNRILSSLGKISYGLYIYHYLINQIHRQIFIDFGIQNAIFSLKQKTLPVYYLANSSQYIIEIIISISFAYISFNYFERYFTKSHPIRFFKI